jgi:hypothetical protein
MLLPPAHIYLNREDMPMKGKKKYFSVKLRGYTWSYNNYIRGKVGSQ